jgi:hypothetical protein
MTPEVIENAEIKKSLPKTKILLDNTYKCDTLGLVEKCVPIYSGRFAFWGALGPLSNRQPPFYLHWLKPVLPRLSRRIPALPHPCVRGRRLPCLR